ncbi:hypothetical protein AVEN_200617-1 [Araneus ventricosus]|uniref:Uncharacterized protein n=1 Tax=Araneus ventricosus TaxID=182803 RepID=A0A4Y2HIM5_ARAVE|nr:hypothetical protein AVEN_200617-1 [Araneus ventricosus]
MQKSRDYFILLLKGLNINYSNDFCNSDSGLECWETNCDKCNAEDLLLGFIGKRGLDNASIVQWHQWVRSENKHFSEVANEVCVAKLTDNVAKAK